MSKKESELRRLLKAIKEGSRESFLVPIQSHQKLSLLPFCRRKKPLLSVYSSPYLARFSNFVSSGLQSRLTVPMGPFLCLAMITSAIFGVSVSLW